MKKNIGNNRNAKKEQKMLIRQIKNLNNHTAKEKKTLRQLLNEQKPSFITKNDKEISLEKEELKKIANIIPKKLHKKLKLPIYIEIGRKYGKGRYRIRGKVESNLIKKILNKEEEPTEKEIFINKTEIRKIRKELKTTTEYTFTIDISEITKNKKNNFRSSKRKKRHLNNF